MKKLLTVFFTLTAFILFGQYKTIDSLQQALKNYDAKKLELHKNLLPDESDTVKADLLWELYRESSRSSFAKAEEYIKELKTLSEQLGYKKGLGNAYTGMGVISLVNGKFGQSMEYHKLAFKYRTEANDKGGLAWCYFNFGNVYGSLSNYPDALKNFMLSIEKAEEINDRELVAGNYNYIAQLYFEQSEQDKGLDYALKAYDIFKAIGDKWGGGISYCLNLISTAYLKKKDYKKAIEYAQLCYERVLMDNNDINIPPAAIGLGYAFAQTGVYDKALEYNLKAMKLAKEVNQPVNVAAAQDNLGIVYLKVAQDTTGKWMNGTVFEKTREGNLRMASGYFKKSEPLIMGSENKFMLIEHYEMHARVLELLGDYKNALATFQKFKALKDSIFSSENKSKITELETKKDRDLKQKESEINLLKVQRAKKERIYFIAGLVLLIALSFSLYNRYRLKQNQNNIISKEKQRNEELLLNILPGEVADEIKTSGTAKAKAFTMVTVMFTDFKDFTTVSEKISAELLVDEIHTCFSAFDNILHKYKIEKIKTIGDAYLCASGLPVSTHTHAQDMLNAAFEISSFMLERKKEKEAKGEIPFELRIGIHTGPVVAGVVGVKKYAYDIWGDTVNIAARMEQNSEAGKINISGTTYQLVKDKFKCTHRGKIQAKNKGEIDMYFVERN